MNSEGEHLRHNGGIIPKSHEPLGSNGPRASGSEVPVPLSSHAVPRFVPKEPYKAAVGLSKRDQERNKLLRRVDDLERKNEQLNQQYKIQLDVNADLKKMLVASMGEDMQERVQFLTEDKQRLATEIAFYTEKLQKDVGQIDELNIECDLWRTKYLASSLLGTELASVKAELVQRCDDFERAVAADRIERLKVTDEIFQAYNLLLATTRQLSPVAILKKHPQNLAECTHSVLRLAEALARNLNVSVTATNEKLGQTTSEISCEIAANQYKAMMEAIASKACVKFDGNTDELTLRHTGVPTNFGCTRCKGPVINV